MLEILPTFALPESALRYSFSRSGGPGGQNVNKVSTRATARLQITDNPLIPEELRARLLEKLATRITQDGDLIVQVDETREQARNKELARERVIAILRQALVRPKKRKATKPTRGSQQRRVESKKRRSAVKHERRRPGGEG
ncbi:MAG: aminoacyl-tRNA hydrolase [Planctomycetes bacterium]|nr:aminoacyl-tRNA hydrolase [Planctomycetota bacterium]